MRKTSEEYEEENRGKLLTYAAVDHVRVAYAGRFVEILLEDITPGKTMWSFVFSYLSYNRDCDGKLTNKGNLKHEVSVWVALDRTIITSRDRKVEPNAKE